MKFGSKSLGKSLLLALLVVFLVVVGIVIVTQIGNNRDIRGQASSGLYPCIQTGGYCRFAGQSQCCSGASCVIPKGKTIGVCTRACHPGDTRACTISGTKTRTQQLCLSSGTWDSCNTVHEYCAVGQTRSCTCQIKGHICTQNCIPAGGDMGVWGACGNDQVCITPPTCRTDAQCACEGYICSTTDSKCHPK